MKDCKKCNNTRTILKSVVFVDRRGIQHENERTIPCSCLQYANKPKDAPELMLVSEDWRKQFMGEKKEEETKRVGQHLQSGAIRRRAA